MTLRKILVANRGEIALRIIRACHELGIEAVAVYSDADRLAPHVLAADEAYRIGPPPSAESYLLGDVLIEVARAAGCDAVHPGYGFLAERAHFARAVLAAGLTFIGPSAEAIEAMGDKTTARRRMIAAGVPVVPGTSDSAVDAASALDAARALGFPVLLKAVAGGGGRGMRVVESEDEIERAFASAAREASAAFGDGSLYLERYLDGPRHIEIQVLADAYGHTRYLGERECSIQRRHQKMIEEAPSTVLTPEQRRAMGEAAVAAATAVAYRNAGTVEFLWRDGEFFFLEMNTRLQVEHPVTELVTGIDIVAWQIRIAGGDALDFEQEDVRIQGHAIECRITSEDPDNGFLPSTGRIERIDVPAGPGVRWDSGVLEGSDVSLYYDPMLAKLIATGSERATAIARMERALHELRIVGVDTSAAFHRRVMREPDFRAGRIDIGYLERHPELQRPEPDPELEGKLALAAALLEEERRRKRATTRVVDDGRIGGAARNAWRPRGWR